jgi:hypothetical protein
MAVKKRKNSICVVYEGYKEEYFLEYLAQQSNVRLNTKFGNGGSADQIVNDGIINSTMGIDVYVFFDEDFELREHKYTISDETLEGLAGAWKLESDRLKECPYRKLQSLNSERRSPILVVSYPLSIEGFLLRLLGKSEGDLIGKTTGQLKNMIDNIQRPIVLNNDDRQLIKFYDKKIAKYKAEMAQQQQGEQNYREHCRMLEKNIEKYNRNKNKVAFMRFLNEKLPLSMIAARRADIFEADLLLKAFEL